MQYDIFNPILKAIVDAFTHAYSYICRLSGAVHGSTGSFIFQHQRLINPNGCEGRWRWINDWLQSTLQCLIDASHCALERSPETISTSLINCTIKKQQFSFQKFEFNISIIWFIQILQFNVERDSDCYKRCPLILLTVSCEVLCLFSLTKIIVVNLRALYSISTPIVSGWDYSNVYQLN